jgi:hypothetical protein
MSVQADKKLNQLVNEWPTGAVYLTSWLKKAGFSDQLLNRYKKSEWLLSLGTGAILRKGDSLTYQGALYALQSQLSSSIHIGARDALALHGKSHYLQLANTKVSLFGKSTEKLPKWFTDADWGLEVKYYGSSFLESDLGLVDFEFKTFKLKISSPVRAMMECLYLAPEEQELMECYELMEGLTNLRPQQVQGLLEACSSFKVKRLFLYFAEKAKHSWLEYLDLTKIDLGKGKRSIVKNGVFVPKYRITLPKELVEDGSLQESS